MMEHLHARLDPEQLAVVQRPPQAVRVMVTQVTFRRGEGCCSGDPVRECVAYYDDDGRLLAVRDPWAEKRA